MAPPRPAPWSSAAPWLDGHTGSAAEVEQIARGLDRLILSLTVGGYEVDGIGIAITDDPSLGAPESHLYLDLTASTVEELPSSLTYAMIGDWPGGEEPAWPADAQAAIALHVQPRYRFRPLGALARIGHNFAVALPFVSEEVPSVVPAGAWSYTSEPNFTDSEAGWWLIGVQPPGSVTTLTGSNLAAGAEAIGEDLAPTISSHLVAEWTAARSAGMPAPGLLGCFDPAQWTFPYGDAQFEDQLGRVIGQRIHGEIGGRIDLEAFVTEQLTTDRSPTERWIVAAMAGGSGSSVVLFALDRASPPFQRAHLGIDLSRTAFDFASGANYIELLFHLHMMKVVDILGSETIGPDGSAPEWIAADLSGFYERRDPEDPSRPFYDIRDDGSGETSLTRSWIAADTLQINVAGRRAAGYWQKHDDSLTTLRSIDQHVLEIVRKDDTLPHYMGVRVQESESVPAIFQQPDLTRVEPAFGTPYAGATWFDLSLDLSGSEPMLLIQDDQSGETQLFVRIEATPWLSDGAMARADAQIAPNLEEKQRRPLHTAELAEIEAWMDELKADVQAVHEGSMTAADLDRGFGTRMAPHATLSGTGSIYPSDQFLTVQRIAVEAMRSTEWLHSGQQRDHLDWLYLICIDHRTDTRNVQVFFEFDFSVIDAEWAGPIYRYKWSLDTWGISVSFALEGSGFGGVMLVEKERMVPPYSNWNWTPVWDPPQKYYCAMVGGSVGYSLELYFGFKGSGTSLPTPRDLGPDFFTGQFDLVNAVTFGLTSWGLFKDFRPGDAGKGKVIGLISTLIFIEMGALPMMTFAFWSSTNLKGLSGGVELVGFLGGYLWQWSPGPMVIPDEAKLALQGLFGETLYESLGESAFFDTDIHTIDDTARDALRRICIANLPLLGDAYGTLSVLGHADREGADEYNLALSRRRATSLYQTLQDILGPHLHVAEENTLLGGRGEAEAAGIDPDGVENAQYRRVDLELNGAVTISIQPTP